MRRTKVDGREVRDPAGVGMAVFGIAGTQADDRAAAQSILAEEADRGVDIGFQARETHLRRAHPGRDPFRRLCPNALDYRLVRPISPLRLSTSKAEPPRNALSAGTALAPV